jgi:hypothetical protein
MPDPGLERGVRRLDLRPAALAPINVIGTQWSGTIVWRTPTAATAPISSSSGPTFILHLGDRADGRDRDGRVGASGRFRPRARVRARGIRSPSAGRTHQRCGTTSSGLEYDRRVRGARSWILSSEVASPTASESRLYECEARAGGERIGRRLRCCHSTGSQPLRSRWMRVGGFGQGVRCAFQKVVDRPLLAAQSGHSRRRVHFARRTPQFKTRPQRPRLAGGGRSHSCRNLDYEHLAGHVGLLPPHEPTAYNGRVAPA